jgi:hypothetical protein
MLRLDPGDERFSGEGAVGIGYPIEDRQAGSRNTLCAIAKVLFDKETPFIRRNAVERSCMALRRGILVHTSLYLAVLLRVPHCLKAIGAVDRFIATWHKGNGGCFATCGAYNFGLYRVAGGALVTIAVLLALGNRLLAFAPTLWAADGVVKKAFLGVKFLFTSGKDEFFAAVAAGDGHIGKCHGSSPWYMYFRVALCY